MPQVIVTDLQHVAVDGVECGSVTDVLENFRTTEGIRSAVLTALQAWHDGIQAAHREALETQSQRLTEAHAAEVATLKAEHEAERAERCDCHSAECESLKCSHDETLKAACANHAAECVTHRQRIVTLEATVREQDAMIVALGGKTVGQVKAAEAKRKALLEAKAKIDADLAAIGG